MPNISIPYTWSVPDTFDINFTWKVIVDQSVVLSPSLVSNGPQNAIKRPTLLYPNGLENILTREIEIRWKEEYPPSSDGLDVWFELFYTENYDFATEPDWKMIAAVPAGIGKYLWKVGNTVKSKSVRCAVRGINSRGERSEMSISATSFTVRKSNPSTPSVLSPQSNARYNDRIQFIFDESGVLNSFSQRAKYNIYCTSVKANLYMIPIAQNIPVGAGPIIWDTATIPPSDDYKFTIFLVDDDGNKSSEVLVSDVAILHEEFFLIDTKPPEAYIQINNGDIYTKDTNLVINSYAYDDATGIHAMKLESGAVSSGGENYSNIKFFDIGNQPDSIVSVTATFEDFAYNRSEDGNQKDFIQFRKNFEELNTNVVDMTTRTFLNVTAEKTETITDVFYAVNYQSNSIIYKDPKSYAFALNEQVLCIASYDTNIFVSVKNDGNTAQVYRWDNTVVEQVITLSEVDSAIISMQYHNDKLYFGCANGSLYSYNKQSLTLVNIFESGVSKMYSDGNLLGIVLGNSKKFYFLTSNNTITEIQI